MAFIDRSTRVGRSQGASIFWGLVSTCFAAAACFYFFQNQKNESAANQLRDQALQLQEVNESLVSQKDHLQASQDEAASQLKTREDLIAQKEADLAAEETRLETLGQQAAVQTQENQAQVPVVKKFNDVIRKAGGGQPDVVERSGRPVLRVPNAQLFAVGDAVLTADGKALLSQIAQGLNGQVDHFDLQVVAYTDTDAEGLATGAKPDAMGMADAKPRFANSWELTAARAAAMARYFRDQTELPFLNVIVLGRGDSEPIASNSGDNHARNRRVEITIAPLPVSFHAPEADKAAATPPKAAPPANPPATPKPVKKADVDKAAAPTPAPAKPKSTGH